MTALLAANGAATTGALYANTSGFGLAQTQAMTMKTKAIFEEINKNYYFYSKFTFTVPI